MVFALELVLSYHESYNKDTHKKTKKILFRVAAALGRLWNQKLSCGQGQQLVQDDTNAPHIRVRCATTAVPPFGCHIHWASHLNMGEQLDTDCKRLDSALCLFTFCIPFATGRVVLRGMSFSRVSICCQTPPPSRDVNRNVEQQGNAQACTHSVQTVARRCTVIIYLKLP